MLSRRSSPVAVIAMTMVGVVGGSYFIVDGATPISPLPNHQAAHTRRISVRVWCGWSAADLK